MSCRNIHEYVVAMKKFSLAVLACMFLLYAPAHAGEDDYSTNVDLIEISAIRSTRGPDPDPTDRTLDFSFTYTSKRLGKNIYWGNELVQCDCSFLLDGRELSSARKMLESCNETMAVYVHRWTVNDIRGWGGKIKCRFQIGGRGIDAVKDFVFK